MKLFKASAILVGIPAIILAGWLTFLGNPGMLVWKGRKAMSWQGHFTWSVIFPKENFAVLGASNQQPLNPPLDERVTILEQFLDKQNSPLATQAATMIEAADTYKLDWKLLPAIAGKESSFGKNIPLDSKNGQSSHNAWGWGVYGDKAPSFSSWEEAIMTVAKGLRDEYYNKGYITPEIIMKKFTPRSDGSWGRGVKAIMEQVSSEHYWQYD